MRQAERYPNGLWKPFSNNEEAKLFQELNKVSDYGLLVTELNRFRSSPGYSLHFRSSLAI